MLFQLDVSEITWSGARNENSEAVRTTDAIPSGRERVNTNRSIH